MGWWGDGGRFWRYIKSVVDEGWVFKKAWDESTGLWVVLVHFSVCVLTCCGRCVLIIFVWENGLSGKKGRKKEKRLFLRCVCVYWTWFLHFHLFFSRAVCCNISWQQMAWAMSSWRHRRPNARKLRLTSLGRWGNRSCTGSLCRQSLSAVNCSSGSDCWHCWGLKNGVWGSWGWILVGLKLDCSAEAV